MRVLVLAPCERNCNEIAVYSKQLLECLRQIVSDIPGAFVNEICIVSAGRPAGATGEQAIEKDVLSSYINAADDINKNYDVCILQHHCSMFGGVDGNYILALTSQLTIPLFTILHAVSSNPSEGEKVLFQSLAASSEKILVFSYLAIEFLEHYYKLNRDKIVRTEHATVDFKTITSEELCSILGLAAPKRVVLSAGEMSGFYGYNTIINALPYLITHYPDIVYVIVDVGNKCDENEYYKKSLRRLAHRKGVAGHVLIKSRDSIKGELESVMQACDVFVSANMNEKELDNVLLAKAVSCGAAVLSTPTWFAKEVLEDQKGAFCSFKATNEPAHELLNLLRNKKERQMFHENASLYGDRNTWPVVGKRLFEMLAASTVHTKKRALAATVVNPLLVPDLNLAHLVSLTDITGVMKQTVYNILDYKGGYSLKDNAVALHTYACAHNHTKDDRWLKGVNTCLAFITSMYDENKGWSDWMTYNRQKNNKSSELSESAAVWALGYLYATSGSAGTKDYAYGLIGKLLNQGFKDIKAKAYATLGIVMVLKCDGTNADVSGLLESQANEMYSSYPADPYNSRQWHEDEIGREAALVPLALLHASDILNNKAYLSAAKRALRFLWKNVFSEGVYSPNAAERQEFKPHNEEKAVANANEAYLMTAAYSKLYRITGEPKYLKITNEIHNWYLGDNSAGKSLYDSSGGGCYAYLSGRSISPEQTAESTCSYWLSHFAVLETYFSEITGG